MKTCSSSTTPKTIRARPWRKSACSGVSAACLRSLILLGDEYPLGSLRLSVQRALFSRVSAAAKLSALSRQDIPASLNWHISQAGLERDIFAPASIDLLAEASEAIPRTLNHPALRPNIPAHSATTIPKSPLLISHKSPPIIPTRYMGVSDQID